MSADLILAVDPGVREMGLTVATFDGHPVDAWLARSTAKARQLKGQRIPAPEGPLAWRGMAGAALADLQERGFIERIAVLVLEWPEVYMNPLMKTTAKGKRFKTNPNDLLELAAIEGALVWGLPAMERYERFKPREWKKSFPKEDYQKAIMAALKPEGRALVERTAESLRHNVIESAGLARFMATVLAGQPMSVPAFQGRIHPATFAPQKTASWRTPLPPSSSPGTQSYGSRHAGEFQTAPTRRYPSTKALSPATPAVYRPRGPR